VPHLIRLPFIRLPITRLPFTRSLLASALLLGSSMLLSSSIHASEADGAEASIAEPQAIEPSNSNSSASESSAEQSWLENARAACERQYGVEQCADPEFFEEHFHANDLQTAHRAAIRRNEMEQRALRELMLQHSCGNIAAYCANAAADCAGQLQQMCSTIQKQAAACVIQAAQYCAASGQGSACLAQRQALCPSPKKQPIDKLLAKYPKLTAAQQANVRRVGLQMDAKDSSWIGNLFRWLQF
jgi:hypothetical protein